MRQPDVTAELCLILQKGSVEQFRQFCLREKLFIARSDPFISPQEWSALMHQAVLKEESLEEKWPESLSWLAQNGFFRLIP